MSLFSSLPLPTTPTENGGKRGDPPDRYMTGDGDRCMTKFSLRYGDADYEAALQPRWPKWLISIVMTSAMSPRPMAAGSVSDLGFTP